MIALLSLLLFAQSEVAVDAGAMTPELTALLQFERPDLKYSTATSTATTRVLLSRDRELLSLEVRQNDAALIERTITIDRERLKPALRVAALLVVEALIPKPPPPPSSLALLASLEGLLWITPVTPRVGPVLGFRYRFDESLSFGARAALSGLIVKSFSSPTIEGDAFDLSLMFTATYAWAELGPNRLLLEGGAGAGLARFKGTAHYRGGVSPEETKPFIVDARLLGAAVFETAPLLGSARLSIAAGAQVRLGRMEVKLPADAVAAGSSGLDPGIIAPFLMLGTAIEL